MADNDIWEQVNANLDRLESCSRHDFHDITPDKRIGKRYSCSRCGGEIDMIAYKWYKIGLEHGARK